MRALLLLIALSIPLLSGCPLGKTGKEGGERCSVNADCASRRCTEGVCAEP